LLNKGGKISFSIVIPNYNGADFLPDCLESIVKSAKLCPNTGFEIILADNASTDNSLKIFRFFSQKYKYIIKTKCLNLPANLGFGAAVNQGASLCAYPYLIVANNDIELKPNWFSIVKKNIKNYPKTSCFYGLVLNKTGDRIESAGFKFFSSGRCENINNGQPYTKNRPVKGDVRLASPRGGRTEGLFQIWGAPASLIVYRRSVFNQLGGFDARFFAYIEDVDLAYRFHRAGFVTSYIPQAVSYHLGGATSHKMGNLRAYMTLRNWLFFIKKNYSKKQIISNFPAIFFERLKNLKYFFISTPGKLWLPQIRTIWIDLLNFDHKL